MKRSGAMEPSSRNGRAERVPTRRHSPLWSPLWEDWNLSRWLDDIFESRFLTDTWNDRFQFPAVDVSETDDAYMVHIDIPGVKREDIQVDCGGNQISIWAERKSEMTNESHNGRHERFYGTYRRTFTVPSDVEIDEISADYQDGVLTLTLPKGESARRRRIPIGERSSRTRDVTGSKEHH